MIKMRQILFLKFLLLIPFLSYFIYKNKRTLLRLDIGINQYGESGIYFGVNEAF